MLSKWAVRANEQVECWVMSGCAPRECLDVLGFRNMPANWAAVWHAVVMTDCKLRHP